LKEWARKHLALIGYAILAIGIAIGFYFLNQSRVALCVLREDLNDRIETQSDSVNRGYQFLKEHPRGAFGFTRRDIQVSIGAQRRSLENSKRTRNSLDGVWCGKRHS